MPDATAAATRLSSTHVVVGIDIGGTGTRFVAVEPATHPVLARVTQPTPADAGREEVLAFLRCQVERVCDRRRPAAIGIGASGPVDRDGIIRNPDTLPAFTGGPSSKAWRPSATGRWSSTTTPSAPPWPNTSSARPATRHGPCTSPSAPALLAL